MFRYVIRAVAILTCLFTCVTGNLTDRADAAEGKSGDAGVELRTSNVWFTLPDHLRAAFNESTAHGVKLHAQKLGVSLAADEVPSQIIVVQSKTLLGAAEDNPNIILAIEKAWSDKFEKTGRGYYELMADRVKQLGSPSKVTSKPKELRIGGQAFFEFDVDNSKVSGATTKQRYIASFNRGHYVIFILSYNRVGDEDFRVMMDIVESVKLTK